MSVWRLSELAILALAAGGAQVALVLRVVLVLGIELLGQPATIVGFERHG